MTELAFTFGLRSFRLLLPAGEEETIAQSFRTTFPAWTTRSLPPPAPMPLAIAPRAADPAHWVLRLLEAFQNGLGAEGFAPFHGAALSKDDRLVLVCGRSGAGKSLFSLLLRDRVDVLADDLFFSRVRDGEVEIVPLPGRVLSKSTLCDSRPVEPAQPRRVSFPLSRVILVFPSFGAEGSPYRLTSRTEVFARLLNGNLFLDRARSHANAKRQLSFRKALSENCEAFVLPYVDEHAGEATERLVRELAL